MNMKLPMLKQDKANHLIYGLLIFSIFHTLFGLLIASITCSVFAFGKEVYDYMNKDKHTPDIYDAVVTLLGGLLGYLIIVLN